MNILCILTTILGHKTVVKRIEGALAAMPGANATCVFIGPEQYAQHPAPRWARLTNPLETIYVAGRSLPAELREKPFHALLVNSWEIAVAHRKLAKRLPTAMIADAVPATVDAAVRQRAGGGAKRWLAHQLNQRAFAGVVPHIDYFLMKSSECALSLQSDFGISPDRLVVTRAPQDLNFWKPLAGKPARPDGKLRLLFVGNDLVRKGGDFLLDLYRRELTRDCVLTMVSTDPKLKTLPPCDGVTFVPGLDRRQLVSVFQNSDVFVFPTRQDYTPEVVAEALGTGLPCLMGEVDGARDLVRDGETGFVMPVGSAAGAWAAHLHRLAADQAELARKSAAARSFAEEFLGLDRFNRTMADAFRLLTDQVKK